MMYLFLDGPLDGQWIETDETRYYMASISSELSIDEMTPVPTEIEMKIFWYAAHEISDGAGTQYTLYIPRHLKRYESPPPIGWILARLLQGYRAIDKAA